MRILVTAGSGLVGNSLKLQLKQHLCEDEYFFHSKSQGDLLQPRVFRQLIEEIAPNLIIHNAAALGGAFASPADSRNFTLQNTRIFENLKNVITPDHIVLCVSSYHVFSGHAPFKEFSKLDLNQESGYASEKILQIFSTQSQKNFKYIFFPHLFGEFDNFKEGRAHFIANSIRRIVNAKERNLGSIEFYGSPRRKLQFASGNHAANVIIATTKSSIPDNQRFTLGNIGWVASCINVFSELCDIIGYSGEIKKISSPNLIADRDMYFDKAQELTSENRTEFRAEMRKAVEYYIESRE
jgi:GDP-L-fucose synthase